MINEFSTRAQDYSMGVIMTFSKSGAGTTGYPHVKQ